MFANLFSRHWFLGITSQSFILWNLFFFVPFYELNHKIGVNLSEILLQKQNILNSKLFRKKCYKNSFSGIYLLKYKIYFFWANDLNNKGWSGDGSRRQSCRSDSTGSSMAATHCMYYRRTVNRLLHSYSALILHLYSCHTSNWSPVFAQIYNTFIEILRHSKT